MNMTWVKQFETNRSVFSSGTSCDLYGYKNQCWAVKKELTAAVGEDWAVRVQRTVSAVPLKQLLRASAGNTRSSVASQGQRSHSGSEGHVASIEPSAHSVRYTANKARQTFAGPAPAELVTSTSRWDTTVRYELVQYTYRHIHGYIHPPAAFCASSSRQ